MRIGVFDSGIGGITVLHELKRNFPFMDYVYLGDTAHVPYGTKSPSQIEKLSVQNARILCERDIDALVIACNTASSLAYEAIQEAAFPVPVFGVVEPGVEATLNAWSSYSQVERDELPILVLATRATVKSQAYGNAFRKIHHLNPALIFEQACPLLVPLIEEGWIHHPILEQAIQEYITPYLKKYKSGVALLGCTHYPWISEAFEKALPSWNVVNSASAVSRALAKNGFLEKSKDLYSSGSGKMEWIFTDPEVVPVFAKQFIVSNSGETHRWQTGEVQI